MLAEFDKPAEQGVSAEVVEMKPQAKPVSKITNVKSSLYLPPQAHRKLKEIALAHNCKVHDLFIEGIDHVLGKKGYPTVAEFSKK